MSDGTAQAAGEGMSEERLAEIRKTARRGEQHLVVLGDCDRECMACAADELLVEVERLHTWRGLISLLDKHYPPDVFDGSSDDPGPRIIALTREVERLRAREALLNRRNAENAQTAAEIERERDRLKARLDAVGEVREELTPAGSEYRAMGAFVHEVTEEFARTWPECWGSGYRPQVRDLYAGPWREVEQGQGRDE